jgi:hypothetical protein
MRGAFSATPSGSIPQDLFVVSGWVGGYVVSVRPPGCSPPPLHARLPESHVIDVEQDLIGALTIQTW